jgi:hypothetical protein
MNPVVAAIHRYNEIGKRRDPSFVRIDVTQPKHRGKAKVFRAFAAWCEERNLDPADYVEALARLFAPDMPDLHRMRTEVAIDEYHAFREYRALRDGPRGIQANAEANLRVISAAQEIMRRNHVLANTPEVCMLQTDPHWLYDPRSDWCSRCRLATQCSSKINAAFGRDVAALRLSFRGTRV